MKCPTALTGLPVLSQFASTPQLTSLTLRADDPIRIKYVLNEVTRRDLLPKLKQLHLTYPPRTPPTHPCRSDASLVFDAVAEFILARMPDEIQTLHDAAESEPVLDTLALPACTMDQWMDLMRRVGEVHVGPSYLKNACVFDSGADVMSKINRNEYDDDDDDDEDEDDGNSDDNGDSDDGEAYEDEDDESGNENEGMVSSGSWEIPISGSDADSDGTD